MVTKDWKKVHDKRTHVIWSKKTKSNIKILSVWKKGLVEVVGKAWVFQRNDGKIKRFKTKPLALVFAKAYMRTH